MQEADASDTADCSSRFEVKDKSFALGEWSCEHDPRMVKTLDPTTTYQKPWMSMMVVYLRSRYDSSSFHRFTTIFQIQRSFSCLLQGQVWDMMVILVRSLNISHSSLYIILLVQGGPSDISYHIIALPSLGIEIREGSSWSINGWQQIRRVWPRSYTTPLSKCGSYAGKERRGPACHWPLSSVSYRHTRGLHASHLLALTVNL